MRKALTCGLLLALAAAQVAQATEGGAPGAPAGAASAPHAAAARFRHRDRAMATSSMAPARRGTRATSAFAPATSRRSAIWQQAPRRRTIDARGMVVAPGFIDMLGQSELTILVEPRLPSKIYQGITTEITGEGESVAPLNAAMIAADRTDYEHLKITPDWTTFRQYFARLERQGHGHQSRQLRRRDQRAAHGARRWRRTADGRRKCWRCRHWCGRRCRTERSGCPRHCSTHRRPMPGHRS